MLPIVFGFSGLFSPLIFSSDFSCLLPFNLLFVRSLPEGGKLFPALCQALWRAEVGSAAGLCATHAVKQHRVTYGFQRLVLLFVLSVRPHSEGQSGTCAKRKGRGEPQMYILWLLQSPLWSFSCTHTAAKHIS